MEKGRGEDEEDEEEGGREDRCYVMPGCRVGCFDLESRARRNYE